MARIVSTITADASDASVCWGSSDATIVVHSDTKPILSLQPPTTLSWETSVEDVTASPAEQVVLSKNRL